MKINKPYLVTCASYTNGCETFIQSLKNADDSISYYSVEFFPHFYEKPVHATRLLLSDEYPGHLRRLAYAPFDFIDLDRWVIFSDTDDVKIQKRVPELPDDKDILVANENVQHNEGFWAPVIKQFPIFESLLDKPVYNAGLFAMKGHVLKEYVSFLGEFMAKHNLTEFQYLDQLILNYWIHEVADKRDKKNKPKYRVGYVPTLFLCLHANVDKNNCKRVYGQWCDKQGNPYTFVHANGNKKNLL
jgi:hypothetical protein